MKLFGFDLAGVVSAVLEFFGQQRRHRKELEREYQRGWNDCLAAMQSEERKVVQDSSAADDNISVDPDVVRDDPLRQDP